MENAVSFSGKNDRECLLVRIGSKKYGFDICRINNLIRLATIVRVPNAQPYLKGIINLRGEIVPVMSILSEKEYTGDEKAEDVRIVVLNMKESGKIGIIVDQIYGITEEEVELFDIQAIV